MKVIVLGADGQVGSAAVEVATHNQLEVTSFTHETCDVRDDAALSKAVHGLSVGDAVINAAARLGTEEPEKDPRPQFETNVRGALLAALAGRTAGASIVHFGTDYVFDGRKQTAYVESDSAHPLNMYGALKLASEVLVCGANPNHYVVRIASVFGNAKRTTKGLNFVDRMLQLAQSQTSIEVDDSITMSPTFARDAAQVVIALLRAKAPFGIYHAANAGTCTWRQFANAAFELAHVQCKAARRTSSVDPIARPLNSALRSEKLAALGITTRPWRDALAEYLAGKDSAAPRRPV